jgi:IS30 family transposase
MKKKKARGRGGSPLTLRERSIIEIRWKEGRTMTALATEINRDKGTVSREIAGKPRKGSGAYNAERSHEKACERIEKRGNTAQLEENTELREYVEEKMRLGWSPEQISIRLPIAYRENKSMRISYEAIYAHVYRQIHRGGNGKVKAGCVDLRPFLPRRHTRRQTKGFRKAQREERTSHLPSIEVRPKVVEKRGRIGDWEDDTLVSRQSAPRVKSIVERRSGAALFGKTKDGTSAACDAVVLRRLGALPPQCRTTLTRDRGSENRAHEDLAKALNISCFFAHAYASYERGTNENTNGLLRRFFPKKTDWNTVSDDDLARAEYLINTRPRKRLNGLTPVEVFYRDTGVALYA